jgi:hypothetical protein
VIGGLPIFRLFAFLAIEGSPLAMTRAWLSLHPYKHEVDVRGGGGVVALLADGGLETATWMDSRLVVQVNFEVL